MLSQLVFVSVLEINVADKSKTPWFTGHPSHNQTMVELYCYVLEEVETHKTNLTVLEVDYFVLESS